MQQIQIIGNLGEDCQIREFNGSRFATFRVACTEKIRRSGDDNEVTTWYSCSLNRPDAGVIPYLKKPTAFLNMPLNPLAHPSRRASELIYL